jgi:hypothetical protein
MAQTGEVVFALERFELSGEDRLEVVGRWEGLEGRRMGRPVLTVVDVGGRRRRIAALPRELDRAQPWRASFAWEGDVTGIERAELELGRRLVVELPPPRRRRRRTGSIEPVRAVEDAAALAEQLAAARAEADDLRERLRLAREGIVERDQRLMAAQAGAAQEAEDATSRLEAERAEAAELRTRLAEAREDAERVRSEAAQAIAAEAEETERLRGELDGARGESERALGAERAETLRLREELASRPAPAAESEQDGPTRRMLDKVTRDLERERATTRTLRRDADARQAEVAELRRAAAVTPATEPQPALRAAAARRVDVARAAGAHRVPDHRPSRIALWGTRLVAALVLIGLVLALALIVAPLL